MPRLFGHENANAADVHLAEAVRVQELHACFVHDRQHRVVADVLAVVEIGDPDRQPRRKREVRGHVELRSCHPRESTEVEPGSQPTFFRGALVG